MFTIFSSSVRSKANNCFYPNKHIINNLDDLKAAVGFDYVCAEYKNNYRNNDNFIMSDCLALDCDNDHSDDSDKWVTPNDVAKVFVNVKFYVHFSRSHNKEKNGKAARPKFHILFPIDELNSASEYIELKKIVSAIFPYFDTKALDAARFFFGTESPDVKYYDGELKVNEFLFAELSDNAPKRAIPEGCRNSTMSRFAATVIKKYGDTDKAFDCFLEKADLCEPPLSDSELNIIWNSAQKFYKKIKSQPGYVSPESYNDNNCYKPEDYSDVGQAIVLANYFKDKLRYSPYTDFIIYTGNYWKESKPGSQAVTHELTRRQLAEALKDMNSALKKMQSNGAQSILGAMSKSKAKQSMTEEQLKSFSEYEDAQAYYKFVLKKRESNGITSTLKEARPMLEISPSELDKDEFLLCTPIGTYDLRKGLGSRRDNSPKDFITKITNTSPSDKGKEIWLDCLDKIFLKDKELINYVQMMCGLAAIGKVLIEFLLIAYGSGANGKSTFFNVIARVLGQYSGKISADALTTTCKRNIKPEIAETKGKRLLIASEMEEGARLSDATLKQLCSTDEIEAEKKYKDPFKFTPTHTLVLYTNHLPKVSANDEGSWRRLKVIPFKAKIQGNDDIKNYADYLYENAGESILSWIIEGAKKVIDANYHINSPKCVEEAIAGYHESNNWFAHFIEDCCEVSPNLKEKSLDLYQAYRNYSRECNEYVRSTTDFYSALDNAGFKREKINRISHIIGLSLMKEAREFFDFLE